MAAQSAYEDLGNRKTEKAHSMVYYEESVVIRGAYVLAPWGKFHDSGSRPLCYTFMEAPTTRPNIYLIDEISSLC